MLAAVGVVGGACTPLSVRSGSLLSTVERNVLSAAGDALVPGASRAGIVPFVTAMLSSHRPALLYDYFSLPAEPLEFYRAALGGIRSFGQLHGIGGFEALSLQARERLLSHLISPNLARWSGPPPMLVYTVLRNDAIDVVYGAKSAYDNLGVPYMPHIEPPKLW